MDSEAIPVCDIDGCDAERIHHHYRLNPTAYQAVCQLNYGAKCKRARDGYYSSPVRPRTDTDEQPDLNALRDQLVAADAERNRLAREHAAAANRYAELRGQLTRAFREL